MKIEISFPEEFSHFTIKKAYMSKLSINCPGSASFVLHNLDDTAIDTINIGVFPIELTGTPYYYVVIKASFTSSTDDDQIVHNLSFTYIALVEIIDEDLDDESIDQILNKDVPGFLFNDIYSIIFNASNATGHPIFLDRDIFLKYTIGHTAKTLDYYESIDAEEECDENEPDEEEELDDEDANPNEEDKDFDNDEADSEEVCSEFEDEKIDYQWIMKKFRSFPPAATFLSIYNESVGAEVTEQYETLPVYNYYLRFFIPIEYSHPDLDECDESLWPMLFQLLFGNLFATCRIIHMGDELPEIEFSYESFHEVTISSLSIEELIKLLYELLTDIFTKISLNMRAFDNINDSYNETLGADRLIRRKEFFKLFGFDDMEVMSGEELNFLEQLYSRIKNCDIQTVLYRY